MPDSDSPRYPLRIRDLIEGRVSPYRRPLATILPRAKGASGVVSSLTKRRTSR